MLVGDPWQGHGLAELLTSACLEIARATGLRRVVAETTADNRGMIAILEHHGFTIEHRGQGEVEGTLDLDAASPRPFSRQASRCPGEPLRGLEPGESVIARLDQRGE